MALSFVLDPELTDQLREEIASLWCDVTNAGGAVGFVAPVAREDVLPIARAAFAGVDEGHDRLLAAFEDLDGERELVAVLFLTSRRFDLQEHWRTVKRVMVRQGRQGRGY